jgi:type II secretory pathway pseudopilin PulG
VRKTQILLASSRTGGFTVIELTVSLLILVIVMLGVLSVVDFSMRLSAVQSSVSEMQQSQRFAQKDLAHMIRMAGCGPLPLGTLPDGVALAVYNQVPEGTRIGGNGTPEVVAGSDILAVRGVLSTSTYQVNAERFGAFAFVAVPGGFKGHVEVDDFTPSGIPQDVQFWTKVVASAVEGGGKPPERLLLVSAQNPEIWTIVALDPQLTSLDAARETIHLAFKSLPVESPVRFSLPAGYPIAELGSVAFVGVVEEYRFYLRKGTKIAPNGTQDLAARLTRARVYPGTDRPWRGPGDNSSVTDANHPNWWIDIADNIIDLQVTLAFDAPRGGGRIRDDANNTGDDDRIFESADGVADDWLFNDGQPVTPLDWANQTLYFIRLTTLARTDRRDPQYRSAGLERLEDHDLTTSRFNGPTERAFRYRALETLIDMRNL